MIEGDTEMSDDYNTENSKNRVEWKSGTSLCKYDRCEGVEKIVANEKKDLQACSKLVKMYVVCIHYVYEYNWSRD